MQHCFALDFLGQLTNRQNEYRDERHGDNLSECD